MSHSLSLASLGSTAIAVVTLGLLAATTPSSAFAQDAIVVEGKKIDDAKVRRTVRSITIDGNESHFPLPRFRRPICPGVWGLSAESAQNAIDRIMANARTAGIEVNEEPGCKANVWLVVTDEVGGTLERLVDDDSFMTRHLTAYQLSRVRKQKGPARAWNILSDRNEQGEPIVTGFKYVQALMYAMALGGKDREPPPNSVRSMSRLDT